MAFIKTGEPTPITSCIESDKELICDKCGKNKTVIKIDNTNEAVCECEQELEEID